MNTKTNEARIEIRKPGADEWRSCCRAWRPACDCDATAADVFTPAHTSPLYVPVAGVPAAADVPAAGWNDGTLTLTSAEVTRLRSALLAHSAQLKTDVADAAEDDTVNHSDFYTRIRALENVSALLAKLSRD